MKTFIFLGPSLSVEEAKQILPQAIYLPPIRCGDILQVLRFNPQLIGIIDGYFENTAAVWHKEILFAMENGVHVIGGSSMGALRASELAPFGMQSVGYIAKDYLSGTLTDDDEVAVLHGLPASGYQNMTEAMVNIRSTIEQAIRENIIDKMTALNLLSSSKQLFYHERTLERAADLSLQNGASPYQIEKFHQWLHEKGSINLKKIDAIEVLQTIAHQRTQPLKTPPRTHKTAFFRALQKNVMCRPFSQYHHWLPLQEKVARVSRYLGSNYRLSRRLAYLLADCYGLALQHSIILHPPFHSSFKESLYTAQGFGLREEIQGEAWETQQDFEAESDKQNFLIRMAKIKTLIEREKQREDKMPYTASDYLLLLLKLSKEYLHYKKRCGSSSPQDILKQLMEENAVRFHLLSCFSECWWLIENQLWRTGLQPTEQTLETYSDHFRTTHQLYTPEATEKWMADHDLDWDGYINLMSANARLSTLILQNNIDILRKVTPAEPVWWLLDALRLTGVYSQAKYLLDNPSELELIKENTQKEHSNLDEYARSLDFIEGESEFLTGLTSILNSYPA